MRTDILDVHEFYRKPLGVLTASILRRQLEEIWSSGDGLDIAGFGYVNPYLHTFKNSTRRLVFAPGGQGVTHWPSRRANSAALIEDTRWPVPDASIDRILIVHGLEETARPETLMREAWRVLRDDGRLIVICTNRRSIWSMVDTTPFAAGRPYLRHQLNKLLINTMFEATAWSASLFFPPFHSRLVLRAARIWERAGAIVWPALAGTLLVEARKNLIAPAGLIRRTRAVQMRPGAVGTLPSAGRTIASSPKAPLD